MISRNRRVVAILLSVGVAFSGALVNAPSAMAAKLNIGVAPSANGYVMAGEPTQIAVSGAKSAKVYLRREGKWRLLGTARQNRALPYTFTDSGVQRVRVKPSKRKARIFKVPVYGSRRSSSPAAFGGQVFSNTFSGIASGGGRTVTFTKDRGCVLLDVGAKNASIEVFSTDSAPWQGSSGPGGEIAQMGIPIAGDTVVTWRGLGTGFLQTIDTGYNVICLNP